MPRIVVRLAVLLGLHTTPAPAVEVPFVHRGERELCAGTAFLGVSSTPIGKLSVDEALRCFGVIQGR